MKLHIFIGISGSGKSTQAKKILEQDPTTIRINRDDIRSCIAGGLKGYYLSPHIYAREGIVNSAVCGILHKCFNESLPIIIDNTNLTAEYIKFFLKRKPGNYEVVFHIFESTIETSEQRVLTRDGKVDISYISKQYGQMTKLLNSFDFEKHGKVIKYEV